MFVDNKTNLHEADQIAHESNTKSLVTSSCMLQLHLNSPSACLAKLAKVKVQKGS